jgi:4-amino-4-deoxy-L-arabinose transferase-like glycosyltransferase
VRAGTLFLLAFGVRLWALGTAWPDFVDEMHSAAGVTHFWPSVGFEDKRLLMPYGNITSFPRLYPFLLSWSVGLFGESLASLRGVSVLFGALTIPALYGLARNLYDEKTALVAGLLLATFPPHYHFSRIALNNIIDPFFGVAALAVLAYAMRTGRARHFALAGALLGLTQYWYEGGRLLYPPLFLIWGGWAWALASFQRGRWGVESPLAGWGGLRGLAVSVLLFIVVAMPIYYVLWGDYRPYTSRLDDQGLSLSEWRDYLRAAPDDPRWERHFTSPLLVLTSRPDGGWFYRGEKPFIGYWLLPFALLGALFAFVRVLGRGGFLLVLWVFATLLGNTFIVTPDWSPRYVVVFPALMLITALGLRHLPYLWALMGGGARVGALMLALVTLILSATSLDYYFNVHLPYNRRQDLAFNHQIDAFSRVADLPPNTHAHFIDDQVYWRFNLDTYRTFHRLTQTFDNIQPQQLDFQYLLSLPRDVPHAFFIDPDDQRSLQMVSFYFLLAPPVPSPDPRLPRERQLWMYYYDPLK